MHASMVQGSGCQIGKTACTVCNCSNESARTDAPSLAMEERHAAVRQNRYPSSMLTHHWRPHGLSQLAQLMAVLQPHVVGKLTDVHVLPVLTMHV